MWLADPSKWSGRFRYVEVARYIADLDKVVRERLGNKDDEYRPARFYECGFALDAWRQRHHNTGIYTSVLQRAKPDMAAEAMGNLYFDLDDKEDPEVALKEARTLVAYLVEIVPEDAIRIYFTGLKGYHVEVEAVALGLGPMAELVDVFRFIATNIKDQLSLGTFDFQVYDARRMWRLPDSAHQVTGLFKVHLLPEELELSLDEIKELASKPRWFKVPDQQFSAPANQWFREWTYQREAAAQAPRDRLADFLKWGSRSVRSNKPDVFDPVDLFEHCPAVMRWWQYAEQEHDLPHEARLFLCSLLSYDEEAEWYLHRIMENCNDYDYNKTEAHLVDWKRRRELGIGGHPFSCEKANSLGVGCGTCDLQPKRRYEAVGNRVVVTGEEALPSPIRFAYKKGK